MDYPLGGERNFFKADLAGGLNPYSNGLPSRGLSLKISPPPVTWVLIPILMDYPLGAFRG